MSAGFGAVAGPAGVTALDHLAERLVETAPNLCVVIATTGAERDAGFRLRYQQVVDQGWASREELPDGMEHDAYDADALQICAWSGETLVGTIRVVLPAPGRRLPVETDFDLDVEPIGAVVEIGRLVIDPMHRGDPTHRAWGALFGRAWLSARSRGFAVLAGTASARMVERLTSLGLPFEILGAARQHWGQERHPVRLDPSHGQPRWFDATAKPG
jgi:N-acyl-L-homoserine lactone synthetase